jgi:Uma2 family endonuclease
MAAAPVPSFVTLYEYLHSDYQPDMDYVDGVLEERNLGEYDHADLQGELIALFRSHRKEWTVNAFPELRVQVGPTRYRVPDVCVLRADQKRSQVIADPPLLCIEILSPEDRFTRIRARCDDYFRMGVPTAWVFDPAGRVALVLRPDGTMTTHRDGSLTLDGTPVSISLSDLFAVLDD